MATRAHDPEPGPPQVPRKKETSSLFVSIVASAGLIVVIGILWVIFGDASDQRPGAANSTEAEESLSRRDLTIIVADDDMTDDERDEARNKEDGERSEQSPKQPPRPEEKDRGLDREMRGGAPERSHGAGDRE